MTWYETADIGVTGGELHEAVVDKLAKAGLRSALNPGHLTGHEEWMHSPVRPGSTEKLASGMPFQVDVIPVPMPDGWGLNCEDAVTFADAGLRGELRSKHPACYARIEARRAFMRDELGVDVKQNILPLSSTPLCLPPFWLRPNHLLARLELLAGRILASAGHQVRDLRSGLDRTARLFSQLVNQLRVFAQKLHQLNGGTTRLDQPALILVERILADLEQFARLAL